MICTYCGEETEYDISICDMCSWDIEEEWDYYAEDEEDTTKNSK